MFQISEVKKEVRSYLKVILYSYLMLKKMNESVTDS